MTRTISSVVRKFCASTIFPTKQTIAKFISSLAYPYLPLLPIVIDGIIPVVGLSRHVIIMSVLRSVLAVITNHDD